MEEILAVVIEGLDIDSRVKLKTAQLGYRFFHPENILTIELLLHPKRGRFTYDNFEDEIRVEIWIELS